MKLFDLHCDTPYRIYHEKLSINDRRSDSPLYDLCSFEKAVQVAAIWSDPRKSDRENYDDFFRIVTYFREEIEKNADLCRLIFPQFSGKPMGKCEKSVENRQNINESKNNESRKTDTEDNRVGFLLAVEGGTLLANDVNRLQKLYDCGVRIFLPTWNAPDGTTSHIGGAHDRGAPFTPFGEEVLEKCDELGILIDYSHASEAAFWQTVDRKSATDRPLLVSHSDSYFITPHTRNLTDRQFRKLIARGGLCGMNLYPPFCGGIDPIDRFGAIVKHILHFRALGGIGSVGLGADRDGIDPIEGYTALSALPALYERLLQAGLSREEVDAIFYDNAAGKILRGSGE